MRDREPHDIEGYVDSDDEWARGNPGAVEWLADNHTAIRAALASAPVADERAAFEASYRSRFNVPAHAGLTFPDVAEAWVWWQARAALVSAPNSTDTENGIRWQAGAWDLTLTEVMVDGRRWYRDDDPKVLARAPVAGEAQERIEQMALSRYRTVPCGQFSHKVVAGDGSRSLHVGPKGECLEVAAHLTEAFLDGAFVASSAAPQASEAAPFAPDWANYRQGWADGLAEGGEAIDIARTALMEIADLADVEADQRGVIVNAALTRIDEITSRAALSAQPGAQRTGGSDAE
jgi:hypothetical protein